METFNQKLSCEPTIKMEVSDKAKPTYDLADDESTPTAGATKRRCSESSSYTSNAEGVVESSVQPRKRAKTQEEREQRKLARVIRNRQAAQASREKKRIYLENLEEKCSKLESENARLISSLSSNQTLNGRLELYESAIRLAKQTGDVSSLDPVIHLLDQKPNSNPGLFDGTITGSMLKVEPTDEFPNKKFEMATAPIGTNLGSPAPSLEEDRSSPDSHSVKSEEEDYFFSSFPDEPETRVEHDPFEVLNFSFDTKPAFCGVPDLDKPSKSRHSAVMTPILMESYLQ